jgi:hypothetical protein
LRYARRTLGEVAFGASLFGYQVYGKQEFRVRKSAWLDLPSQPASDIEPQSFSLAYDYPVAFAEDEISFCARRLVE